MAIRNDCLFYYLVKNLATWNNGHAVVNIDGVDVALEPGETVSYMHPVNSFRIKSRIADYGYMGVLHPVVKKSVDKRFNVVMLEVDFVQLAESPCYARKIKAVSKYQAVEIDYNILCDVNMKYIELTKLLAKFKSKIMSGYELIDIYENKDVLGDKKSVTLRFNLASFDHTLSGEEIEKLERIFGIVSYSPAVTTKSTFEDIESDVSKYAEKLHEEGLLDENTKFAISCRRVGNHEFSSQEMAAFAGAVVVRKYSSPVDLTNPELTIYLEVRDNDTYIFHEKIPGPGGLPLGTQGKVVALVSSGIDSPVATYLMMKRGCQVIALFCDNDPYTTPEALKNFNDLIDQLNLYASGAPIKRRVVKYLCVSCMGLQYAIKAGYFR